MCSSRWEVNLESTSAAATVKRGQNTDKIVLYAKHTRIFFFFFRLYWMIKELYSYMKKKITTCHVTFEDWLQTPILSGLAGAQVRVGHTKTSRFTTFKRKFTSELCSCLPYCSSTLSFIIFYYAFSVWTGIKASHLDRRTLFGLWEIFWTSIRRDKNYIEDFCSLHKSFLLYFLNLFMCGCIWKHVFKFNLFKQF